MKQRLFNSSTYLALGLILFAGFASLPAIYGQRTLGTISGTVSDETQAVLPGVSIIQGTRHMASNRQGTTVHWRHHEDLEPQLLATGPALDPCPHFAQRRPVAGHTRPEAHHGNSSKPFELGIRRHVRTEFDALEQRAEIRDIEGGPKYCQVRFDYHDPLGPRRCHGRHVM